MRSNRSPLVMVAFLLASAATAMGQEPAVPEPADVLGFEPGADFELASWSDVVDYFRRVDASSDRIHIATLGRSTQGRPFLAAVISNEETIAEFSRMSSAPRPNTCKHSASSNWNR